MKIQSINYATITMILISVLAAFTPRAQADEPQFFDHTQRITNSLTSTGSESSVRHQALPAENNTNNIQHNKHGIGSSNMGITHHDMPKMDSSNRDNQYSMNNRHLDAWNEFLLTTQSE